MRKKIFLFLLCLTGAMNGAFAATDYTLTGSGSNLTLTITGTGAMTSYGPGSAPWYSQIYNIKTLVINNGVTSIGERAFENCIFLTSVTIPSSVTSIGAIAFFDCRSLTSITIPNSVASIGIQAFAACRGLTDITVNWATPLSITGRNVFYGVTLSNVNLHVPAGTKSKYQTTDVWKDFNILEPQTITFDVLNTKTYGDASFMLSASASSGLPITFESNNATVATVLGNTVTIVGAGEATITALQAGNADYDAATNSRVLTVNKAPLTITANDVERRVGEANPPFTLSYSGFKNGEDESALDLLPTASCPANETSLVGDYIITLSGGNDKNYIYVLVNGKLEVKAVNGMGNIAAGQLKIFPNPVKNELFIQSDFPVKKVEILSLAGALLLSENNFNEKLPVSALQKGIYLIKVYTDKGVVVSKVVKE